jgi:hypothetical protein
MRRVRVSWLALAFGVSFGAVACVRQPNVSTDALPLKRVVVYRNGVAYFERSGEVAADQVEFRMRQRMVGDFLASLAIVERGGSSVRAASFPLELPEEVEEEEPAPPPDTILGAKRAKARKKLPKDPGERMRDVVVSLDGKRHSLAIGYVAETPVWKPSYRLVVRPDGGAELQAWGIVQNLSGEDWKGVRLSLVAGAPIAFESTLGDPVVPSRPMITDTGEVIAAVPTGETTLEDVGGPIDRVGGAPPPPAPMAEAAPPAEAMDEDMAEEAKGSASGAAPGRGGAPRIQSRKAAPKRDAAPKPSAAPAPEAITRAELERGPSAPRRLSALAAVAVEGGSTRYEIPDPVTVPDRSATMVLLLSRRVPGEAVFLYSPDPGVAESNSHPFRVVRFTNATPGLLERGPIAVFERGSFLGQGLLDPLPPGAKATVPFALERSLAVEVERRFEERGARLHKIEAGELWIERDQVQKTLYRVKNGGQDPAKLLIKHFRDTGARLYHPPAGTEENTGTGSALIPITVKPTGRAELTVDERRGSPQRADWLSDLADEAVKAFLTDARVPQAQSRPLQQAWELRNGWRKLTDELRRLEEESRQIDLAANETRANLKSIEKNTQAADLRARLTARLAELASRQDKLTQRLVELRMELGEKEIRFREAVREIRITEVPPPADTK